MSGQACFAGLAARSLVLFVVFAFLLAFDLLRG